MSFEWIRMLLIFGALVLLITLACSRIRTGKSAGNMTLVDRETSLDGLPSASRTLALLIKNSRDRGFYWLDLDARTLYLAKKLESNWPPERSMITWTGTHLVYGSRPHGFLSLHPDGSQEQITEFGYPGKIARDGERILRFRKCGADESGSGYWITPLDRWTESPLICIPRRLEGDPETWHHLQPIWNAHLARADFIVSRRRGTGREMVVESSRLVQVAEDGEIVELQDLGPSYPDWVDNGLQPTPDGRAFYLYDDESGGASIFDRQGTPVVDFAALDPQLPHLQRTRRFSWSPDSRRAALLFEERDTTAGAGRKVLVLATDRFASLQEVARLPDAFRFRRILWSPDGAHLGFVTDIHQGRDDPPRIYTIELADGSAADYRFPTRMILGHVSWIR